MENSNSIFKQDKDINIKKLLSSGNKYGFLAGAGLSLGSPSNLPAASSFISYLLSNYFHEDAKEDLKEKMNYTPADTFIRFEGIMEIIKQSHDKQLKLLEFYGNCNSPNFNHYFLADMVDKKNDVFTTNFDHLIEHAGATIDPTVEITPAIYDDDFKSKLNQYKQEDLLWKLHGSVIEYWSKQPSLDSLGATLDNLAKGEDFFHLEPGKSKVMRKSLQNHPLMVLGYSGMDDFDVIPTLVSQKSSYPLFWVEHTQNLSVGQAQIFQMNEDILRDKSRTVLSQELKRYYTKKPEEIFSEIILNDARSSSNLYYIKCNTQDLLKYIWQAGSNDMNDILKKLPESPPYKIDLDEWFSGINAYARLKNMPAMRAFLTGLLYHKITLMQEALKYYKITEQSSTNPYLSIQVKKMIADVYSVTGDHQNAHAYLKQVVTELEKTSYLELDKEFETHFLNSLAVNLFEKGDNAQAEKILNSALNQAVESNDARLEHYVRGNLALCQINNKQYNAAEQNLTKAFKISKDLADKHSMARHQINLAMLYATLNQLNRGIEFGKKGLELFRELRNQRGIGIAADAIGFMLDKMQNLPDAVDYYKESERAHRISNNKIGLARVLNNMAVTYSKMRNNQESFRCRSESYRFFEECNSIEQYNAALRLGLEYVPRQDIGNAKRYLNRAIEGSRKYGILDVLSQGLITLGIVQIQMGYMREARALILEGRDVALKSGDQLTLSQANKILSQLP